MQDNQNHFRHLPAPIRSPFLPLPARMMQELQTLKLLLSQGSLSDNPSKFHKHDQIILKLHSLFITEPIIPPGEPNSARYGAHTYLYITLGY